MKPIFQSGVPHHMTPFSASAVLGMEDVDHLNPPKENSSITVSSSTNTSTQTIPLPSATLETVLLKLFGAAKGDIYPSRLACITSRQRH